MNPTSIFAETGDFVTKMANKLNGQDEVQALGAALVQFGIDALIQTMGRHDLAQTLREMLPEICSTNDNCVSVTLIPHMGAVS